MITLHLKPTQKNIDYAEQLMNIYSDYELKHINEEELEQKLEELKQKTIKNGGLD